MLDRDRADLGVLRQASFGWELGVVRINTVYDVVTDHAVQLQVNGALFLIYDILHLAI
jgi:hypothetical protein